MKNKLITLGLLLVALLGAADNQCGWACFSKKKKQNKVQPADEELMRGMKLAEDAQILKQIADLKNQGLPEERLIPELKKLVGELSEFESYKQYINDYRPDIQIIEGRAVPQSRDYFTRQSLTLTPQYSPRGSLRCVTAINHRYTYIFAVASARPILRNKAIRLLWIVDQERLQELAA